MLLKQSKYEFAKPLTNKNMQLLTMIYSIEGDSEFIWLSELIIRIRFVQFARLKCNWFVILAYQLIMCYQVDTDS